MKKIQSTLFAFVIAVVAIAIAAPVLALDIGEKAPKTDVEMKNAVGEAVSISDVAGENGTLVIFSCNSCPWVQAWEERIVEMGNSFQDKGVGVILINSNDPEQKPADSFSAMKKRADEKGYDFPYVMDETSDVARAFDATRTPEAFLFNASGELVYHGTIDDNAHNPKEVEEQYLKTALEAVVNGKEVPQKKTKALGCTIKFREA
ncbi:MAG: thioredoxin family protein [Candidatus Marinimicrobia bacterium]|nr:thioredoxin family protein [Candidatus Neomarinimicrobiota bacterium]MCF7827437.1 thioredoxin family protein [Candidatus Neomarinimicrobiota bacterium]MCF7882312.1 thioredoxin family protein [Candidatus Neomarinimicrobiota bacterium]